MDHCKENSEAARAVDFKELRVTSDAFQHEGMIPLKFTCDGENFNPSLAVEHIPEEAKCLVLIVDDPDAPKGTWVHWVVFNMPVTHHIKENEIHGIQGTNDFGQQEYGGP